MSAPAVRCVRREVRWTALGRNVLLLALSGAVLTLPLPRSLALASVLALFALGVSLALAWWSSRRLLVHPPAPRTITAGQSFQFELELEQEVRWLAARELVIGVTTASAVQPRAAGFVADFDGARRVRVACQGRVARRGRARQLSVLVSTTQPLGLFEVSLRYELPIDWLALPALGTLRALDERLASAPRRHDQARRTVRGDDEFYALRDGREGESMHLVHWRSTARRSKPVVRELRSEEAPPVCVTLVGAVASAPGADGVHPRFERAVSLSATLVEHYARERRHVRFRFAGATPFELEVHPERRAVAALLARLAEVQPGRGVWSAPRELRGIVVGAGLSLTPRRDVLLLDVERPETVRVFSLHRRRAAAVGVGSA